MFARYWARLSLNIAVCACARVVSKERSDEEHYATINPATQFVVYKFQISVLLLERFSEDLKGIEEQALE